MSAAENSVTANKAKLKPLLKRFRGIVPSAQHSTVCLLTTSCRVVIAILDAFHFDLQNTEFKVTKLPSSVTKRKARGVPTGKTIINFLIFV